MCGVEWSDLHFFSIFENGHIAIDWLHFYENNAKKLANFAACSQQIFHFQKITETLQINILFEIF